ncbi:TPA: hypothetical protein KNJ28_001259 [Clostridioides difficile]|nr:hypothetical protein [Clostridioides difficile]
MLLICHGKSKTAVLAIPMMYYVSGNRKVLNQNNKLIPMMVMEKEDGL